MKCLSKISIHEDGCFPKCSGLQISNFVQNSIEKNKDLFQSMDLFNKMQLKFLDELYLNMKGYDLPASLTQWSKYYLHKCKGFIFQFQNFQKIQNFKI